MTWPRTIEGDSPMTRQTTQGSAAGQTSQTGLTSQTSQTPSATAPAPVFRRTCDPATSMTKTLLAYGVLAGPVYVVMSLAQALTREGFELTRHQWSQLCNGPYGWVQVTNFVVTGLMMGALAAGLRRALRPGRRAVWVPRLVGGFGASLVAAGMFRADPALGFPPGTPDDVMRVSWHGMLHFAAAGVGFTCLALACLMVAGEFAAEGARLRSVLPDHRRRVPRRLHRGRHRRGRRLGQPGLRRRGRHGAGLDLGAGRAAVPAYGTYGAYGRPPLGPPRGGLTGRRAARTSSAWRAGQPKIKNHKAAHKRHKRKEQPSCGTWCC
jgi:hypothetical protein